MSDNSVIGGNDDQSAALVPPNLAAPAAAGQEEGEQEIVENEAPIVSKALRPQTQNTLTLDSTDTRRYVVGFMFDFGFQHVALIRKNKPAWQAGKLNGVGGKIEAGETPEAAMWREGQEEAGIDVNWNHFCTLSGTNNDGGPFLLEALWTYGDLSKVSPLESEEIEILPLTSVAGARAEMIGNLPWLIELARDCGASATAPRFVEAHYGQSVGRGSERHGAPLIPEKPVAASLREKEEQHVKCDENCPVCFSPHWDEQEPEQTLGEPEAQSDSVKVPIQKALLGRLVDALRAAMIVGCDCQEEPRHMNWRTHSESCSTRYFGKLRDEVNLDLESSR